VWGSYRRARAEAARALAPALAPEGVGCGVEGLGLRVWGSGFGVQGLGFRGWGLEFMV